MIIAYEDRLTRFGIETLKKMFTTFGTEVVNHDEKTQLRQFLTLLEGSME
ncbi:MAG: hypothetical protein QXW72_00510 [Conexivisphaerales archaeon]